MDDLAAIRQGLLRLKSLIAAERFSRALYQHYLALKAGFDPDQPRDELGRWTDAGGNTAEFTRVSDRPADSDARAIPANIQLDPRPPQVTEGQVDNPLQLLNAMTEVQPSIDGTGAVGFVSGGRTDLLNGFMVTGGTFGVVLRNPNTGNFEGWLYHVPSNFTATIVTTPQGDVRVMYARNWDI